MFLLVQKHFLVKFQIFQKRGKDGHHKQILKRENSWFLVFITQNLIRNAVLALINDEDNNDTI